MEKKDLDNSIIEKARNKELLQLLINNNLIEKE